VSFDGIDVADVVGPVVVGTMGDARAGAVRGTALTMLLGDPNPTAFLAKTRK
jgi:hypothetical protein